MPDSIPTKRKPNSPRAPGIDLPTAVAEVGKVYSRYSHGSFTKGELASALAMSAASGAFLGKSAALREYGLIEEVPGGGERVSNAFRGIYQAPMGSTELKRAALSAILHSPAFARLLQQFGPRVPDEDAVALRLESQERFNAERARVVASAFRRSLAEYGLIDRAGNVLAIRDDEGDAPAAEREAPKLDDVSSPDLYRVEVPLGASRRAVLLLPEDLTTSDARRITAVLRAFTEETDP